MEEALNSIEEQRDKQEQLVKVIYRQDADIIASTRPASVVAFIFYSHDHPWN